MKTDVTNNHTNPSSLYGYKRAEKMNIYSKIFDEEYFFYNRSLLLTIEVKWNLQSNYNRRIGKHFDLSHYYLHQD